MNATAQEPRKPGGYLFEDQGELPAYTTPTTDADIRKQAHIVNGGDASFDCPKCHGTGRVTWGYVNIKSGPCFKCKATGKMTAQREKAQVAYKKGAATKAMNAEKFRDDHRAELAYMHKRIEKGSNYYYGFKVRLDAHGTLNDGVIDIIRKDMAKDAEFYAAKDAERNAAGGEVGVDRIDALFATATANGLKKPIFRTERLTIKRAPATGRNAGALYVTDRDLGGEYVGKIVNGKFEARREAKPDTLKLLCEIAADPLDAAVRYGRSTGTCCACGRELTDADSVAAGIGPICAGNFGL